MESELDLYTSQEENTFTNKAINFIKNNILNFILFISCVAFIFKDMILIEESEKTLYEIFASGALSLVASYSIDLLLAKKGTLAGQNSKAYRNTMARYGEEIDKTDDYIDKLDDFCDAKNEQRIIRIQKKILRMERIKYDDFINKEKHEVCGTDKYKIKAWDKAMRVNIHMLSSDYLLSETDDRYEKGKKEKTLSQEESKSNFTKIGGKLIFAIIAGYFTVSLLWNEANLLWGVIQVAIWLIWGILSYIQRYLFVVNTYRQRIIRKTKYLIEFNTINKRGGN